MSEVKRVYQGKAVEMLTVTSSLVAHAIAHKSELQAVVEGWDDPYFENLQARIDTTTKEFFGIDAAKQLREATSILSDMQKTILNDIGLFKVVVEERFKADASFVANTLKTLGISQDYRSVQAGSQEALIQLLSQFSQNLSEPLKAKLVAGGVKAALIDKIASKADELRKANINQEVFKGNRKATTQEALTQFNALYNEVIGISKIAAKVFKADAATKNKFNYTLQLKALTGSASAATQAKKAKTLAALQ